MGRFQKGRSSSHSPPSPLSPGSFHFDNPSQWLKDTVCYILEGLGGLVLFRLRSLIIIALLLIITSGIFTLKPVRSLSDRYAVVALVPSNGLVLLNFSSCPLNLPRVPSIPPGPTMKPLSPTTRLLHQTRPSTSSYLRPNRTSICAKPSSPAPSSATRLQ